MDIVTFHQNSTIEKLFLLGGWGSRKLHMVSPGDRGYTGLMLKTASTGGKGALYVAPLQEELDTKPLPPDSKSFSNMPTAVCQSCHTSYPLQILALHLETCEPSDIVVVCIDPFHVGR